MKLSKEFKIGIVVVCSIAAFVWGVNFLKGSNLFSHKYYLYAVYPKIENLIPASPLMVSGYKVGQINKITLIKSGGEMKVLVKFILTEDLEIPKGSTARSVSSDLLGSKAVEIIFSKSKEFVKSGDTLIAENETGFKESFSKQFAPLQAKAENLISNIDTVMAVVNSVLNKKTRDNIDKSFESVRKAILSLEQTANKLDDLVGTEKLKISSILSLEQTANKLDDLVGTEKLKISSILSNLNQITTNLRANGQKIDNIIANVSSVSDSLAKANLKMAIEDADKSLKELNTLLARINEGKGTLGKLAKNDSLYNNLNKSALDLDKLLEDLRLNPGRYVHISVFGKKDKAKPVKP